MAMEHQDMRDKTVPWPTRVVLGVVLLIAVLVVWVTNVALTQRFTQSTRGDAELQMALHGGNLVSELRRHSIIPQLMARDPALIAALRTGDHALSTQRLISFVEEIDVAGLTLLDLDGRTVAATDRNRLGTSHRDAPHFLDALRASRSVFSVQALETGGYSFYYSQRLSDRGEVLGVIALEVDLRQFERAWSGVSEAVMVTNSEGTVVLSTAPRWRGLTEAEALEAETPQNAILAALRTSAGWTALPSDAYVQGEAVMRLQSKLPFRGWRMTTFTTYAPVRERVNAVLALEIMGFALLLAVGFYALSRRSAVRVALFRRESAELRQLNRQLQQEIAERKRMQETLAVAEQTLEQSSKLAALGEMSAAVSHELNQPLAAMKTYLAGAELLLRRNRPEEAVAAFGRIDDLIERMGAITRQLKSYARKGEDAWRPVNMQDALASALSMMEPQLRQRKVQITRNLPREPVEVLGDLVRIEQVMVNLLRNAIDATKSAREPRIDLILAAGETATLTIRDNGPGIEDTSALFEPFYTTKTPGDGVGLGLAISSGIVNELGGRLTARNGQEGGAVFEMQLPLMDREPDAEAQDPAVPAQ